ncbi:hypothetical protein HAU46_10990 [Weissella confusa]|uniref:hypothetical protein n=1 Tax=Weissella confusa TaxID=1583 RepID=UPI0018F2056E|nr:hypothetical protein [Weissella confusa]MBJ7648483.1 hypothetical protein [Weissella confusa]
MKKSGIIFATIALLAGFGVAPAVFADGTGHINATVDDSNAAPTISGTADYNFGDIHYSWLDGKASLQDTTADPNSNLKVQSLSNATGYKLTAAVKTSTPLATVTIPDKTLELAQYSETSVTPSTAKLQLKNGADTNITGTITYTIVAPVTE